MSRAQRLLDLIQLLRGYRRPLSGAVLAEALRISDCSISGHDKAVIAMATCASLSSA
jgi:predicted DNA-binding transcriptional regulator YafY